LDALILQLLGAGVLAEGMLVFYDTIRYEMLF